MRTDILELIYYPIYFFFLFSDSPTLLACSSCDLALQFSQYIALHLNSTRDTIVPITELQDDNNSSKFHQISKAWGCADALLYIMEKVNFENND